MSKQDEFFVGYLPTPKGLALFYKVITPVLIILVVGFGFWFSKSQKSAGTGIWDLSGPVMVSGYLTVDPYPVIHFVGEDKRSVILVQQGKKSANPLAKPFANQWVSVSGIAITRGDWSMLELSASSEFKTDEQQRDIDFSAVPLGDIALKGEIIDSKCFLGVMKPGAGKAHRACAAMCLRGGMPPMFVVTNSQGDRFGYLLMHENGESASLDLVEHVGLPVELKGSLEKRGDMLYLRYDKASVSPVKLSEAGHSSESFASVFHQSPPSDTESESKSVVAD